MNKYIKAIVTVLVIAVSLAFLYIPASADNVYDYLPEPNYTDYPSTADGYSAYFKDYLKYMYYNTETAVNNIAYYPADEVKTYFTGEGSDLGFFIDPRSAFSGYYMNGGSTSGSSYSTYYPGKDGKNYFLTIISNPVPTKGTLHDGTSCYILVDAYLQDDSGNIVASRTSHWSYASSKALLSSPPVLGSDGVVRWGYSYSYDPYEYKYNFDVSKWLLRSDGSIASPETAPVPTSGIAFGHHGHIIRYPDSDDPNGDLHFIDDDDNGKDYFFDPDGFIIGPDGQPYYFTPDPDDVTDEIENYIDDWSLLMLASIENLDKKMTGNGCSCKDYSSILQYIANQCTKINNNLDKINNTISKEGLANFFSNIFGGLVSALGGVLGGLLSAVYGDIDDSVTKSNYYSIISAILIALNNMLPLIAISDVMNTLENYVFKGGAPADINLYFDGDYYTFLSSSFLETYKSYIDIIKNFISIVLIYGWLRAMRRKVASV